MNTFASALRNRVEGFIELRRSLGYDFYKDAALLRAFQGYVQQARLKGPLTQDMALAFSLSNGATPCGRFNRYGTVRRFSDYMAVYDPCTERLDPRVLPRPRKNPPPRILTDRQLQKLLSACACLTPKQPHRGRTMATLLGLLASTGLRSGEARRLDRVDVDLNTGVLHIRKTKFGKDRYVPVHATTLVSLQKYARLRDRTFPAAKSAAFFMSIRGNRLSHVALYNGLKQACAFIGLNRNAPRAFRPHDLRYRFVVKRLAEWHRLHIDAQTQLPLLATYLGLLAAT